MIGKTVARAGITQLVECKLPKLDVAGSNPVARSNRFFVFLWIFCDAVVAISGLLFF